MLNARLGSRAKLGKFSQGGPVHGKGFCFPAGIMPAYNIPDVEGNEPWNAEMWQCDLSAVRKYESCSSSRLNCEAFLGF